MEQIEKQQRDVKNSNVNNYIKNNQMKKQNERIDFKVE